MSAIQPAQPAQPAPINAAVAHIASLQSPASRRTQRAALDTMAAMLTDGRITSCEELPWAAYVHALGALRTALAERYKPGSANTYLAAARGVMRAAWRLGQLDTDTFNRAMDGAKNVAGKSVPAGRDLAGGELGALATACAADASAAGVRDAAIIGILYTAGLRRAELAALRLEDYDRAEGRLLVRGKGNKERWCYPAAGALAALDAWLSLRGRSNTRDFAPAAGPMFAPVNKRGEVDPRKGITAQAIYNMLRKRAAEAGVDNFSPHDLRRTFVSAHLEAGTDIATVAAMAGHSNVQTTARYDRRGERAKAAASGQLHWAYSARQKRQR